MTFRSFVARLMGIIIGCVIAQQVTHMFPPVYFWWITAVSALVGGILADIIYEPSRYRAGLSRAWNKAVGWRPNGLYWKAVGSTGLATCMMGLSGGYAFVIILCVLPQDNPEVTFSFDRIVHMLGSATLFFGSVGFISGAAMITSIMNRGKKESDVEYQLRLGATVDQWLGYALKFNPIGSILIGTVLAFKAVVYLPAAIRVAAELFAIGVMMIIELIKLSIEYTHSDERLIIMVNVGLGVLAAAPMGYSWLGIGVGMLAGAAFGLVHSRYLAPRLLGWATTLRR